MTTNSPWGVGGSESTGEGTGGPLADRPSDNDEVGCRFNTFPFGVGNENDPPTPTPTYYKLTECDTSAVKYTTGALTSNIASELGNVVELDEYAGGWLVETTTSPGTTEALTITASHVDCETYTAAQPSDDPCGDCGGTQPSATVSASMTCNPSCGSTTSGSAAYIGFDGGTCTWSWETADGGGLDPTRTVEIQYDAGNDEWIVSVTIAVGDPLALGVCSGTYYEVKAGDTFVCVGGVISGTTTVAIDGFSSCTGGSATLTVG